MGSRTTPLCSSPDARRGLVIALVTDAWLPQVNGVTTTLSRCCDKLTAWGHHVGVLSPDGYRSVPCPRYPHIRLALWPGRSVGRRLAALKPHAVHIATEGPLGVTARCFCRRRGIPFTTAFHTRFAEYLRVYAHVPVRLTYRALRWFHSPAVRTLVPTESMAKELEGHGFRHLVRWRRGVDTELFRPREEPVYDGLERPVLLYVGRVAAEKNIDAFLRLDLPGSKVVVGDGPARPSLERDHPDVRWAGFCFGDDLARHYADADVLVFPSRTDTFGVVMLEANACGVPVAAYPVTGPVDVVSDGVNGALDDDLEAACRRALTVDRSSCRRLAAEMSWDRCARQLLDNLAIHDPDRWS